MEASDLSLASWQPPSDDIDGYDDAPGYAGFESIFGLFPPGGCEACKYRPPFDVSVDITDALRTSNLRRDDAVLKVSQTLTAGASNV